MNRREFFASAVLALQNETPAESALVRRGADGNLEYLPDEDGNTIPDFSAAGYGGGGVPFPEIPVRMTVPPEPGDATERIQAAIDALAALPLEDGWRGAVLLPRGRYEIGGTLRIRSGGIVLRGEGDGEDGTVLLATGTEERALIEVRGRAIAPRQAEAVRVMEPYVPVGRKHVRVESGHGLTPGATVLLRRVGNAAWIHFIGMDRIKPRPGAPQETQQWKPFDLDFDRVVTGVEGDLVTFDAPLTCAIEDRWGGGMVVPYSDAGRIRNVGIEGLRGVSSFDPSVMRSYRGESYHADERHCREMVTIDNAADVWVRNVTALHFVYSCVSIGRGAKWVTVRDCACLDMVSEITGSRRYPYSVSGQLCLVQGCTGDTGRHDFAVGSRVCGPNVFLDCKAGTSYASSEPHHRWSVGGLYDNVRAEIAIQDRQYYGTGHGWAGANYVVWNCEGPLVCQKPPGAQNWAIGHVGPKRPGAFAPREDGWWESHGRHVRPRSLYLAQLAARRSVVPARARMLQSIFGAHPDR